MTIIQKLALYGCGIIAAVLFTWPAGPLVLFFIADMNGDVPTRYIDPR